MAQNFSRIEDYINNELNDTEKGEFENELKTNQVLTEQYNFYKNIKKQQAVELKPITYQKKILPEINDINFTEKKDKPGASGRTIVGIIVIFVTLSSYLFLSNNSNKNEIAILKTKKDSIEFAYQNVLSQTSEHSNIEVNTDNLKNDVADNLQKIIVEKENEIVSLKLNNETTAVLKQEIAKLKKDLAKTKQEYYENSGNFASNDNNSLKKTIASNFNFSVSKESLRISWSKNKYKIEIYDSKGKRIKSTSDFIAKSWETSLPEVGFYKLRITSSKKDLIYVLINTNDELKKVWLPL